MSPVVEMAVCGHMFCNWDWRIVYIKKRERLIERSRKELKSRGRKSITLTAPEAKLCPPTSLPETPTVA